MSNAIAEIKRRHAEADVFESDGLEAAEWRAYLVMLAGRAHADRAYLLRALDEAQAALQFYADPANHIGHRDPSASVYIETSAVDTDGGKIARAALNQEPKA